MYLYVHACALHCIALHGDNQPAQRQRLRLKQTRPIRAQQHKSNLMFIGTLGIKNGRCPEMAKQITRERERAQSRERKVKDWSWRNSGNDCVHVFRVALVDCKSRNALASNHSDGDSILTLSTQRISAIDVHSNAMC